MGSVASNPHRDKSSAKTGGGSERKMGRNICRSRRSTWASEWKPMHQEECNNSCNPIPGCCDQPANNDAANAFQNQCAHGIQKSRLTPCRSAAATRPRSSISPEGPAGGRRLRRPVSLSGARRRSGPRAGLSHRKYGCQAGGVSQAAESRTPSRPRRPRQRQS